MSWSAYADYKDSSIRWLGKIPSHWTVDRIKWSVQSSQNGIWGNEADGGSDDIRCVRVADFDRPNFAIHDRDVTYRSVSRAERRGRIVRRGDLILEKSGGGEKNPVGFVVLYDREEEAVTSNFVARVSLVRGMEPRFWTYMHHWLYSSRLTQPSIKQTSGIQNLDQQSYFDERVGFPPDEEQILVADFLDRETAKIDVLIAKQEQLITTLREDRAASITKAVTTGLNPHVRTVRSGAIWLGSIPAHWRERRLKHVIAHIDSGTSVNGSDVPATVDEVGVLKTSCVSRGQFQPDSNKTVIEEDLGRITCQVQADSLIVNRANTPALVGSAGYVAASYPFLYLSDKLWQVTFNTTSAEFVYYWTQTGIYRSQIAANCVGASSSMQNLSMTDFRNINIAIPPVNEQREIVKHLAEILKSVDTLIAKSTAMIATLREYRSALITDAVTGKIDVRGVA